jgi:hypothetical protein
MEFLFDLEQGSLEWQIVRHAKIGGSRSKQLLKKTDTLLFEMISETIEEYNEDDAGFINDAMERGNELEPQARIELGKYLNLEFIQCGWIQSDIKILGISPDGITPDKKISCEIKCPGSKKHVEYCLNDSVPSEHLDQCIHYFTVNPLLEKHYFLSYRPEFIIKPMLVKMLTRESEVNIGTKAKPVIKTIAEVVELKKSVAIELEKEIEQSINKLNF